MLKFITKTTLASVLIANSAFAMEYFVGGSVAQNTNYYDTNQTGVGSLQESKDSYNSMTIGLEGGAVFDLQENFFMSAEAFFDFGVMGRNVSSDGISNKQTQNFFAGIKTRAIYQVADKSNVYGTLGFGIMNFKAEGTDYDAGKSSFAMRLGVGMEHRFSDLLGIFLEFNYDLPFQKGKDDSMNIDYKVTPYGFKMGARFFF
jgi:hypothetical protein